MISANCICDIVCDDSYIRNFCAGQQNLNIGFFNAQSLKPSNSSSKFDELNNLLSSGFLSVVGVTETWLKPYVPNKAVSIAGYKLFRNDRPAIRGGGVGLYISNNLKARKLSSFSVANSCEALFLHVTSGSYGVVIGVVYLPIPKHNYCRRLQLRYF